MTRRSALIASVLLFLCASLPAWATDTQDKPFLAPLFTNDMVLQRGVPDPVWGWTEPGKQVTVSINGKTATATADQDGKWMAKVGPLGAGGPYDLVISGPQERKLTNVLIGDVWLCSGQSNMELGITEVLNAKTEIAQADHPQIRLFTVPKIVAYHPQTGFVKKDDQGKWLVCSPKNIMVGEWGHGFSGVAYFFGRDLQEKLHIPIGLIHSSWGGTSAEAWTSAQALEQLPDFRKGIEKMRQEHPANEKEAPLVWNPLKQNSSQLAVLYNGMIAPLEPFAIKGVIWYQGENNADRPAQYRRLLPALIRDWRSRFGVGEFPFYIVQLAAFGDQSPQPENSGWAELREAQDLTARTVGNSAIAVATDVGEAHNIHPKNKQEVGRRLMLDALALTYGKDVEYSGPVLTKMKIDGNKAILHFDHLAGGLETKNGAPLKGFAISGNGKKFVWADASIQGDTVVVSSPEVEHPAAVRYAWGNNPEQANLYNKAGLPAPPFRTDGPK